MDEFTRQGTAYTGKFIYDLRGISGETVHLHKSWLALAPILLSGVLLTGCSINLAPTPAEAAGQGTTHAAATIEPSTASPLPGTSTEEDLAITGLSKYLPPLGPVDESMAYSARFDVCGEIPEEEFLKIGLKPAELLDDPEGAIDECAFSSTRESAEELYSFDVTLKSVEDLAQLPREQRWTDIGNGHRVLTLSEPNAAYAACFAFVETNRGTIDLGVLSMEMDAQLERHCERATEIILDLVQ